MQTLVAVYPSRAEAEQAKVKLTDCGVPANEIALSPESAASDAPVRAEQRPSGFWEWLFGSDVDDNDRELYSTTLSGGRTAVSLYLSDDQRRDEVERLLHTSGAVDLSASAGGKQTASSSERIPIVKEELKVGKLRRNSAITCVSIHRAEADRDVFPDRQRPGAARVRRR